jgi:hypothetical protein
MPSSGLCSLLVHTQCHALTSLCPKFVVSNYNYNFSCFFARPLSPTLISICLPSSTLPSRIIILPPGPRAVQGDLLWHAINTCIRTFKHHLLVMKINSVCFSQISLHTPAHIQIVFNHSSSFDYLPPTAIQTSFVIQSPWASLPPQNPQSGSIT